MATLWRSRAVAYRMVATFVDRYEPYGATTREALEYALSAHVATPWYDVYGAMGAGMQGAWVNRRGRPWEAFDGEPDLVVDSLPAVADALDA